MNPCRRAVRLHRPILSGLFATALVAQEPPPGAAPPPVPQADGQSDAPESWAAESRPVALTRTPSQVRVFNEDDILRSGTRTLGEFLVREIPGQVQNEGGPGLPSRSFMGGTRPQDSVVIFDGIPITDPGQLGTDLNEIPLLGVTRIEVITGSPGMGLGGAGGTIALFTGRPEKEGLSGDVSGLGGGNGKGGATVAPGYAWDGGYFKGGHFSGEEQQTIKTVRPYRQVTNFFSLGQKSGDAIWTLGLRSTSFGVPVPFQEVTDSTRVFSPGRESRQRSDSGLLKFELGLSPKTSLDTTFSLTRFRHEAPGEGQVELQRYEGREGRLQVGLNLQATPRTGFSFRLDGSESKQMGTDDPAVPGTAKGRTLGAGVEWRFDPVPRFRVIGQARYGWTRQSIEEGGQSREVLKDSGAVLRLALNQELGWGFRAYAGLGSADLAPHLIQQLRNAEVQGAAPLKNERMTFTQVGLAWGTGKAYARAEAQQIEISGGIGVEALATAPMVLGAAPGAANVPPDSKYVNQDRFRTRGVETAVGWTPIRGFALEGFVRAQEARDLNAPEGQEFSTPVVQRRPFSTHGLKTRFGTERVQVDVHYTNVGHQFASIGDCNCAVPVPTIRPMNVTFKDVGMTTTVKAGKRWTLVWRGEHLLQPRVSVAEWVAGAKDSKSDAYMVYGYPAARPSYSFEARYRYEE
ncbi:MAG: TonB-dependent receptor [Acidobacteria bacterium]|nr:TonB-dependent receptor [Acidobacteriota bacterium]